MVTGTARMTVEEFDVWVMQPENADKRLEYVGGEIVEVVSNNYSSLVAAKILIKIGIYLENNPIGYVTGADGGYQVSGERYMPDVAYISKERQPEPCRDAYNVNAPDLVAEVLSPSDSPDDLRLKVANFLAAGVVVWVVEPDSKTVEVYTPGQKAYKFSVDDTLDGGDVLPGFSLPVKDIFPD
jgi:Uma2 family endonuclease